MYQNIFDVSKMIAKIDIMIFCNIAPDDGAICAVKHLELVHAYHVADPYNYTDLTNSIWGTKY